MSTIQGLDLRAKDESGQEIEVFKVQWIKKMAFGVIGEHTTEKKFLELFVPELQADIEEQRKAAQKLCRIYFEIAEEFISADEIRKKRDGAIEQALKGKDEPYNLSATEYMEGNEMRKTKLTQFEKEIDGFWEKIKNRFTVVQAMAKNEFDISLENKRLKNEIEAAKKLCQIYFEIAEEYCHADVIRKKRDAKIEQALKDND